MLFSELVVVVVVWSLLAVMIVLVFLPLACGKLPPCTWCFFSRQGKIYGRQSTSAGSTFQTNGSTQFLVHFFVDTSKKVLEVCPNSHVQISYPWYRPSHPRLSSFVCLPVIYVSCLSSVRTRNILKFQIPQVGPTETYDYNPLLFGARFSPRY